MWPFRKHAPQPPASWAGPASFADWTPGQIGVMSVAIRKNGQPESDGFRVFARVALNTLRGGSAVELVARAMEESANPGHDPDRPITGSHYLAGMPHWCVWAEYAQAAVDAYSRAFRGSV